MNIYLIIHQDRHVDTEVYPRLDKERTIAEAKELALEYNKYPEDFEEEEIDGWLYYARYSCEGDSVRVIEAELK